MATYQNQYNLGFLIWDSKRGLNCTPSVPQGITNPAQYQYRPASLVPKNFTCDGDTQWVLYDDYESLNLSWGAYATGQRNGIAQSVPQPDGTTITYLWDIKGFNSSDVAGNVDSPLAKMEAWISQNVEDLDDNGNILAGQYNGLTYSSYPALASATTYCYSFTRTDVGDAQALSLVELFYANVMVSGSVLAVSHVYATGVSTYRICFTKPVAQIGTATGDANFTLL